MSPSREPPAATVTSTKTIDVQQSILKESPLERKENNCCSLHESPQEEKISWIYMLKHLLFLKWSQSNPNAIT